MVLYKLCIYYVFLSCKIRSFEKKINNVLIYHSRFPTIHFLTVLLILLIKLFLYHFIFLGKCVSSCINTAVGDTVIIPFEGAKLLADNELRWTHNTRRVYLKKGSQVKLSEFSVTQHGSLMLENVQKDNSGEYKGIVYNTKCVLAIRLAVVVCISEPVPDPTVLVECIEKGVNLTCSAVNNNAVVVSWMKNGMKANATHAVLHVSSSELKSGDNFSCTVSNMISHKSAKEVEPVCSDTGLDIWWMLVILTGGGSFLLILFIICLVCVCCCSRRNKRKAKGVFPINYFVFTLRTGEIIYLLVLLR
uniref:Ig-like domain-containing protein n=1 Tax=Sinocyclocheilus rhinocerous TaxID=307959 RepID=A0A673I9G8_9TELE